MYVKNVSFQYKKATDFALKNVTFEIKKDKVNAIVGLNGSGKTTLFDCMTKVLPSNGEFKLPLVDDILYQTQSLFFSPSIKVKDFVQFVRRIDNKKGVNDVNEFQDSFGKEEYNFLVKLWNKKIGTISIGERKWVFMMMLSQLERALYIFDEPMSGVDPKSRLKMTKRIQELVMKKKTCILSTHQLHDLAHFNCHLILLHNQTIKYEGDYLDWLGKYNTTNPDIAFEMTCD